MPQYPFTLSQIQKLSPMGAARFVAQMKSAIEKLHALGFVHCDIKPDNIFIDNNGNYVLGDLDSATAIGSKLWECTWIFIPSELQAKAKRSKAHKWVDYTMLLTTLYDKTVAPKPIGVGNADVTSQERACRFKDTPFATIAQELTILAEPPQLIDVPGAPEVEAEAETETRQGVVLFYPTSPPRVRSRVPSKFAAFRAQQQE
jgi:serine/threonine protein kinase